MSVTVCICTYKRPERLLMLLTDLREQTVLPGQVVVVDNDATGSARSVVENFAAPFLLNYEIQPQKNISLTRNRSIALAKGEWLGLLDDDERIVPVWLEQLIATQKRYQADIVLAPVLCEVPESAPEWLRKGSFYARLRFATGSVPPLNRVGIGNAFIRAECLRQETGPFDPALGLTGGEDGDLLTRLAHKGYTRVWCDEALATEPVESARLNLNWLLRRSLRGGQDFARNTLAGRFSTHHWYSRPLFYSRALVQLELAFVMSALTMPLGRHRSYQWLCTASANLGKLSRMWGWHYAEYAAESKPKK